MSGYNVLPFKFEKFIKWITYHIPGRKTRLNSSLISFAWNDKYVLPCFLCLLRSVLYCSVHPLALTQNTVKLQQSTPHYTIASETATRLELEQEQEQEASKSSPGKVGTHYWFPLIFSENTFTSGLCAGKLEKRNTFTHAFCSILFLSPYGFLFPFLFPTFSWQPNWVSVFTFWVCSFSCFFTGFLISVLLFFNVMMFLSSFFLDEIWVWEDVHLLSDTV